MRTTREIARRNAQIAAAVRTGGSLRIVGQAHGISHERVRQIVERVDPGAIAEGQRARAESRLAAERERQRPLLTRTCAVCGSEFTTTNRRRVTDSSECATAWAGGIRHASPGAGLTQPALAV